MSSANLAMCHLENTRLDRKRQSQCGESRGKGRGSSGSTAVMPSLPQEHRFQEHTIIVVNVQQIRNGVRFDDNP